MRKVEYQALKCAGLSKEALAIYSDSEIDVFETENERFNVTGIVNADELTVEELEALLLAFQEV